MSYLMSDITALLENQTFTGTRMQKANLIMLTSIELGKTEGVRVN